MNKVSWKKLEAERRKFMYRNPCDQLRGRQYGAQANMIQEYLEIADEGFTPKPLTVDIVGKIGRKLTFKMVFLEGNIKA